MYIQLMDNYINFAAEFEFQQSYVTHEETFVKRSDYARPCRMYSQLLA
jgi:hypothetical protein